MPAQLAELILPIPFNDTDALRQVIGRHGDEAAMVILEPINYNSAGIMPDPGYLELLRELTEQAGIVLFFDEIQSAFKSCPGGAQEFFGVTPDVCTIGKSLGGGLPLSAFCGRVEIMDLYKPVGPVQHSGTFNAHLVPVLSGLAFMNEMARSDFYPRLQALGERLYEGLDRIIADNDLNMVVPRHGARFNILLGRQTPARRYEETFCHDRSVMLELIRMCFEGGLYLHDYGGGPAHHGYCIQHTKDDIDQALEIMGGALKQLKADGKL